MWMEAANVTESDAMANPGLVGWQRRSPLAAADRVATTLETGGSTGVRIVERAAETLIQVSAWQAQSAAVRASLAGALGFEAPVSPRITQRDGLAIVWSGPGQWWVLASQDLSLGDRLASVLAGVAAVTEQSGSRVLLRLSGPEVRRALAKVIALDLDPSVFAEGCAAMTDLAHVPVHFWRSPDAEGGPVFEIATPRSFAPSVWQALIAAAAEYGLEASPADPTS